LRGEYATNLVIQAFSDVMHQEVVVVTVHGVRRFLIININKIIIVNERVAKISCYKAIKKYIIIYRDRRIA